MTRPIGVTIVGMGLLLGLFGVAPRLASRVWTFESDEPGCSPRGFQVSSGTWNVVRDGVNLVLVQQAESGDKVFNLMLAEEPRCRDLTLSARLKRVSGKVDQGGGIVWRAIDRDNYYIARYNPLEDNLRLYKVEDGKRTQLDHADAPGDSEWHTLRISMNGREILGYLDGKKLLEAEDSTFPDAGMVGLWSKADARTYFDDLTVEGK